MASNRRKISIRPAKRPSSPIGWREYVGLPELGIPIIRAKLDTGARTSALHVENIRVVGRTGRRVAFSVPYDHDGRHLVECVARLVGKREIKNSGGLPDERFIIRTVLAIGRRHWHIEASLADRSNMEFDLILGRTALRRHGFVVDPSRSFLAGEPVHQEPLDTRAK